MGVVTLVTYRSERPRAQTHGGGLAGWCQSIVSMFRFQIGIPSPSDDVTDRRVRPSRSWTPRQFIKRYRNGSEGDGLQVCSGNNDVYSLQRSFLVKLEDCGFKSPGQEAGREKQKPAHSVLAEVTPERSN